MSKAPSDDKLMVYMYCTYIDVNHRIKGRPKYYQKEKEQTKSRFHININAYNSENKLIIKSSFLSYTSTSYMYIQISKADTRQPIQG